MSICPVICTASGGCGRLLALEALNGLPQSQVGKEVVIRDISRPTAGALPALHEFLTNACKQYGTGFRPIKEKEGVRSAGTSWFRRAALKFAKKMVEC